MRKIRKITEADIKFSLDAETQKGIIEDINENIKKVDLEIVIYIKNNGYFNVNVDENFKFEIEWSNIVLKDKNYTDYRLHDEIIYTANLIEKRINHFEIESEEIDILSNSGNTLKELNDIIYNIAKTKIAQDIGKRAESIVRELADKE